MKKSLSLIVFIFFAYIALSQTELQYHKDFEVITMANETFNLYDFWEENPDFIVALEFFFVDSQICKETSPKIDEAFKRMGYNEENLFFLSINVSNDSTEVAKYRDSLNLDIPVVVGEQGGNMVDTLYKIQAYPTFLLMQKNAFFPDTVWLDSLQVEYDTTISYEETNFLEKDLWPILSADWLVDTLMKYEIIASTAELPFKERISFSLYPNPASDKLNILSNKLEGYFYIDVLDINGRIVRNTKAYITRNTPLPLDIKNLEKGVYVVRIRNDNGVYSRKIIMN